MSNSKPKPVSELTVNELSKNGHGQAILRRENGKEEICEVPYALPGEIVEVELLKKHKGLRLVKVLNLITSSDDRVEPKCEHFGHCGGCCWQQLSYPKQLEIKQSMVANLLSDYINSNTKFHPILAAENPWNYRNKVELTFSTDRSMNHYLGFILHNSRGKVFNLIECYLVPQWMNKAVSLVRDWWINSGLDAYHGLKNTGSLRNLTLREGKRTSEKMVILTVSGNPDFSLKKQQLETFVSTLKNHLGEDEEHLSIFLRIHQIKKGSPTNFYEMHLSGKDHIKENLYFSSDASDLNLLKFQVSPAAFFQPNTVQAEKLYQKVADSLNLTKDSVVYDLYCGTGTLGIFLSRYVKEVHGIEITPESVLDARENIRLNQISNVFIYQGDVGKVLKDLLSQQRTNPDIIIVDPPRSGLDAQALRLIMDLLPNQIVYVSCNVSTQALNLSELLKVGYQVEAVQAVDQFPHTKHIENIVFLKK